jgi:hypothetical protein
MLIVGRWGRCVVCGVLRVVSCVWCVVCGVLCVVGWTWWDERGRGGMNVVAWTWWDERGGMNVVGLLVSVCVSTWHMVPDKIMGYLRIWNLKTSPRYLGKVGKRDHVSPLSISFSSANTVNGISSPTWQTFTNIRYRTRTGSNDTGLWWNQ